MIVTSVTVLPKFEATVASTVCGLLSSSVRCCSARGTRGDESSCGLPLFKKGVPTMTREARAKRHLKRRKAVIRKARRDHKVDTLFITNRTDIRYLSGGTEGAGGLLFGYNWSVVFTGKMFEECRGLTLWSLPGGCTRVWRTR